MTVTLKLHQMHCTQPIVLGAQIDLQQAGPVYLRNPSPASPSFSSPFLGTVASRQQRTFSRSVIYAKRLTRAKASAGGFAQSGTGDAPEGVGDGRTVPASGENGQSSEVQVELVGAVDPEDGSNSGAESASEAPSSDSKAASSTSFAKFRWLPEPVVRFLAAFLSLPLVRFFTHWPAYVRRRKLKRLEAEANANPEDKDKQAAFLVELNKQNPAAVIERFERQKHDVDAGAVVEYLRALIKTDEIKDYLPDDKKGRTTSLAALLRQLSSFAGGEAIKEPGLTQLQPLHVTLVGSHKEPEKPQGGGLLASILRMMVAVVVTVVLWIGATVALRRYVSGVTGMSTPSSVSAPSSYAPKEYNKEAMPEKNVKTFKDVKGCDEAKAELEEIVQYLKNPEKFTRLGGMLPKGVLLTGPPGTGKTLLAKAIAGEAGVPFFYRAGSEFEEMFVGVGSRRVRGLFGAAKKKAPCIVFIDEIDAIGGSRKHWENHTRKTLNQLLVEMDGFEANEGIIVLAATNLPETLDPALTRPGRFDRHVHVPAPDVKGRLEILELYLKDKPIDPDVDVKLLARTTPGFSGADLANLVNTAAVKAAVDGTETISTVQLEFAKDKILMGSERRSAVLSEESRRMTAYHESGHAVVALNTDGANPVHKATIMPRGTALGMVMQLPDKDETSISKRQMMARLDVCMGGRVAEEIVFGHDNVTTGASSDLKQATSLARYMVKECGMSDEIGPIYIGEQREATISSDYMKKIDAEVVRLLKEAYERVQALLKKHEGDLHKLANALLEHETLTGKEVVNLLQRR